MSEPDNKVLSTAEKMLMQEAERRKADEIVIENIAEYAKALVEVANTPNGAYVFKIMVRAMGVFTVKPNRDGMALVGDKALRDFYLTYLRPHLDAETRQIIES